MANRDRHRPGLVYGPVRPSGSRDTGRIVGNLLGFLVVVATVGVLGLAVYLFLQSRGLEPASSAHTPSAELSAAPAASTSAQPSPSSVALASASPTSAPTFQQSTPPTNAGPTPGPTLFVPPVVAGPGFITFGTNVDAQLHVTDAKTTFALDEPMVWSAYLTEPANSVDLRIRMLRLDATKPSGQALVHEDAVKPDVRSTQVFFRRLKPIGSSEGPGLYTIEYVRGQEILATGSFLVQ